MISPNGFGKTTILSIIHNFLFGNFRYFSKLIFKSLEIRFANGRGIRITRSLPSELFPETSDTTNKEIHFTSLNYALKDSPHYVYSAEKDEKLLRVIERRLPVHRIDPDTWLDNRTDTILSTHELLIECEDHLPSDLAKPFVLPDWLKELHSSGRSHLIETQRLLSLELDEGPPYSHRKGRVRSESVVEKDADDLSRRILRVVNNYSTESQRLDPTFPKRIIENREEEISEEGEIRSRLDRLRSKRDELFAAGLIGESVGEPISHTDDLSNANIRRILSIHINDSESKMSVFDDIYEKVHLFKEIINGHFLFKRIAVDQHDGISAYDEDSSTPLKLSELSLGEQHELVLIYELLFVVEERALILIDKPELSLHVGWQRRFIKDLRKIQALRKLQFVIATHSPQIIAEQWDLVRELSPYE